MGLAENIKQIREQHGLTQKEFAEAVGVSAATVSTWEIGTRQPRMGVIEKISRLYDIRKSDIIEDEESLDRYDSVKKNPPSESGGFSELTLEAAIRFDRAAPWVQEQVLSLLRAAESANVAPDGAPKGK